MLDRDGLQNGVAEQATLLDWRIGHDRKTELPAPNQEVELYPPVRQVIENLIGRDDIAAR